MINKIQENIEKNRLFTERSKLLLGISGGVDSVVLAYILREKYSVSLAHCNFNLRGKESDADEIFCVSLAKKLGIPVYTRSFDTKKISVQKGISIQMAARELRYKWFEELLVKHKLDLIVTAHHADDQAETFFMNLVRGSGIKGLKGMESKNGNVVRPLLEISKKEIISYAEKKKIKFREDSSNTSDKYERNFIRLNIIPLFRKLNPSFDETMIRNLSNLTEENNIIQVFLGKSTNKLVKKTEKGIKIRKKDLLSTNYPLSILHSVTEPFGFNYSQTKSVLRNLLNKGISGKRFFSSSHILAIGREFLHIESIVKKDKDLKFTNLSELKRSKLFKVEKQDSFTLPKSNELILREKDIKFPLKIRNRNEGDRFYPFGMTGSKLVSDFMKDEKIESLDRDRMKILENGNKDLLWIIPYRSSERYRIGKEEKGRFIKLSWFE